ncbi:transcriptional regulator [Gracilibacillus phocaeensis]|uniref:transcriptional regulator n=1 Tax=Gracilibacillus phocaeensis TaxID=2042304 RepID=UPI001031C3D6|nr:transcriptional regulator [Gracilibacillus phocaeensis]
MMGEGIAYQNKDILLRFLSDFYKDVTLDVFGLEDMPKIKGLLPNDFPEITADDARSDTFFELDDSSILMLEYESNTRFVENHLKYMRYAHRMSQRFLQKEKQIRHLHVVVVYTSDVEKVSDGLDIGDVSISSTPILLSDYNGDTIMEQIGEKMEAGKPLTHEELFQFSLVPLMHSVRKRNELIQASVELAKRMDNEQNQVQVIAGILTATDKFIDDTYAKQVKEWLRMTKVGRAFEEEKQEAVEKASKELKIEIAQSLLDVLSLELIAKKTGLTLDEVKELKQEQEEKQQRKNA